MTESKINSFEKEECRLDMAGLVLHCSDFAGNSKTITECERWSRLVNQQFKQQFQLQLELQIDPTPYFKDLDDEKVRLKNERGFLTAIVEPIWGITVEFLGQVAQHQYQRVQEYLKFIIQRINQLPD